MNYFSRETTRGGARTSLLVDQVLWRQLLHRLSECGGGVRESGAFLLGTARGAERIATAIVPYIDLDPHCFDEGYVRFEGRHYGKLWELCDEASLTVVADVHTHPGGSGQSDSDRAHPMIAIPGHIALIIPNFARGRIRVVDIGAYVYRGRYRWSSHRGRRASRVIKIRSGE
jgi:proteasome lid subunit RPN8/RPN11